MTLVELSGEWGRLVGSQIAAISRPSIVASNGVLVVQTTSATWSAELDKLSEEILAALPSIDGVAVRAIVWRYVPAERPRREHSARGTSWR